MQTDHNVADVGVMIIKPINRVRRSSQPAMLRYIVYFNNNEAYFNKYKV